MGDTYLIINGMRLFILHSFLVVLLASERVTCMFSSTVRNCFTMT